MRKRIGIQLSQAERKKLEQFSRTGSHSVRLVNRAKIILGLDESDRRKKETQAMIANHVGVSRQTVNNVKNAFLAAGNVEKFLQRSKRETPPVMPKVTGEVEAHIIALACSKVPEGHAKWTLRLLADRCVKLGYVDSISPMTVSRLFKKRNLSLT
jgi:transposase